MTYKVVITPYAKHQLEMYIAYTLLEFKNRQAAKAIKEDALRTTKKLSYLASSLPLCENVELANYGYRIIRFDTHDFFMVYSIHDNLAVVEAMYHELQDYEAVFTSKVKI